MLAIARCRNAAQETFACVSADQRVHVLAAATHETIFEGYIDVDLSVDAGTPEQSGRALDEEGAFVRSCAVDAVRTKDGIFRVAVALNDRFYVFLSPKTRPVLHGEKGRLWRCDAAGGGGAGEGDAGDADAGNAGAEEAQDAPEDELEALDLEEDDAASMPSADDKEAALTSRLPLMMRAALGLLEPGEYPHGIDLDVAMATTDAEVQDADYKEKLELLRDVKVTTADRADVRSVSWSPEGDRLAVAFDANDAEIFAISEEVQGESRPLKALRGHKAWVHKITWSACDAILATSDISGEIRFWNVGFDADVGTLRGDDVYSSIAAPSKVGEDDSNDSILVSCLDLSGVQSDEGGLLVTGYQNGVVRVWVLAGAARSASKFNVTLLGTYLGHGSVLSSCDVIWRPNEAPLAEAEAESLDISTHDPSYHAGFSLATCGFDYRCLLWEIPKGLHFAGVLSKFWTPSRDETACRILEARCFELKHASNGRRIPLVVTRDTYGSVWIWESIGCSSVAQVVVEGTATSLDVIDGSNVPSSARQSVDLILDEGSQVHESCSLVIGDDKGGITTWRIHLVQQDSSAPSPRKDKDINELPVRGVAITLKKKLDVEASKCGIRSVAWCSQPSGATQAPEGDAAATKPLTTPARAAGWGSHILVCDVLGRVFILSAADGAVRGNIDAREAGISPWRCISYHKGQAWVMATYSPGAMLLWKGGSPHFVGIVRFPSNCSPMVGYDVQASAPAPVDALYDAGIKENRWTVAAATLCGRVFIASGSVSPFIDAPPEQLHMAEVPMSLTLGPESEDASYFAGLSLTTDCRYLVGWTTRNLVVVWKYDAVEAERPLSRSSRPRSSPSEALSKRGRSSLETLPKPPGGDNLSGFTQVFCYRFGYTPMDSVITARIQDHHETDEISKIGLKLHAITRNGWIFSVDVDYA